MTLDSDPGRARQGRDLPGRGEHEIAAERKERGDCRSTASQKRGSRPAGPNVCRSLIPGPLSDTGMPPARVATCTTMVAERSGYSAQPLCASRRASPAAAELQSRKRALRALPAIGAPVWKRRKATTDGECSEGAIQTGVSQSHRTRKVAAAVAWSCLGASIAAVQGQRPGRDGVEHRAGSECGRCRSAFGEAADRLTHPRRSPW